jgi:predicted PurR-regulated permease PerM
MTFTGTPILDFIWTTFLIFIWIAYLMILIQVFVDLFRDRELGGGAKALWFIFLIFAPFLAASIYLIARGRGMAERQVAEVAARTEATNAYIRQAAASGPAGDIASAKALLDAGTIDAAEFEKLKKKALA